MADAGDWLIRIGRGGAFPLAVVCIPQAGAGVAAFRHWSSGLDDVAELWAARLPGRETRLLEDPLTSIESMADALLDPVSMLRAQEVILFGHCSGALIAYELAHRLEAHQQVPSVRLIVSSQRPPATGQPVLAEHADQSSLTRIVSHLGEIGGTESGILQHAELMELLAPAIRADIGAVDIYSLDGARPPINIPVFALGGKNDHLVSLEELAQWRNLTASDFTVHLFDGDHFYLTSNIGQVLDYIRAIIVNRQPSLMRELAFW